MDEDFRRFYENKSNPLETFKITVSHHCSATVMCLQENVFNVSPDQHKQVFFVLVSCASFCTSGRAPRNLFVDFGVRKLLKQFNPPEFKRFYSSTSFFGTL